MKWTRARARKNNHELIYIRVFIRAFAANVFPEKYVGSPRVP